MNTTTNPEPPAQPAQDTWIVSTASAIVEGIHEGSIHSADRAETIARVFGSTREELDRRRSLIAAAPAVDATAREVYRLGCRMPFDAEFANALGAMLRTLEGIE